MSESTIPASLIIDQIDNDVAVHDRMIEGYAQLLRNNKTDWVSANHQIFEVLLTLQAQASSLRMVLQLAGLSAECQAGAMKVAAAAERNQALLAELRANYLFNGPKRVPA